MLHINDVFYTIQGEGGNAGSAALFVRMPFCNLACPWCDTEFNSFTKWEEASFEEEAAKHLQLGGQLAVITGGEPSMNKHTPKVIEILKSVGYKIAMESNGQFLAPEGVDHLTISPKRWINRDINDRSDPFKFDFKNKPSEIKLVIDGGDAFLAAIRIFDAWMDNKFSFADDLNPLFYLSPEWEGREKWIPQITEFVMAHPEWRVSLQTHKLLDVR